MNGEGSSSPNEVIPEREETDHRFPGLSRIVARLRPVGVVKG
jgi:hypothetical protein